jgi:hypothetical protein
MIKYGLGDARGALVAAAFGAALPCCTPQLVCSDNVASPVTVVVVDGTTGLNVCDAEVTATDGASTLTTSGTSLDAGLPDATCEYFISPASPGTYSFSASAPGRTMSGAPAIVTVQQEACGLNSSPFEVTITLSP